MAAIKHPKDYKIQPFEVGLKFSFHRFRKLRLYFAWLFAIVLTVFAKSTDQGFWMGAPIILVGEAIRIWSHGYIKKAVQLATSGPYAYVRNPLYFGNFLIGLGFCVIIWHPALGIVFTLGFFGIYWLTIKGEEQRLAHSFGKAYTNYVQNVPRFFPRFTPYHRKSDVTFNARHILNHSEHVTILSVILLYLALYLRQEFYQNHEPLTLATLMVAVLAFGVGILLSFSVISRWPKGNKN